MRVILTALLLASVAATGTQGPKAPATATPVRQANVECGGCHQEILRNYLQTPMANAAGIATDRAHTGSVHQASSDIEYAITKQGGGLEWSFWRKNDPLVHGSHRLEYFLGSGHLGTTYLYSEDGYFLETPVAYYAAANALDMKPGLTKLSSLPPPLPMTSGCMRCHMTGVQKEMAGSMNRFSGLPFLDAGISCQACHGDTTRHVATKGKAAVINPSKLDAERRDSICISCHLEGDTRIEHAGKSALDFQPGERIGDYLSYFVYDSGASEGRGVTEIEELMQSKCKRVSGDSMSCVSCHDPHYSPPPQERPAFYRKKCLACHSSAKFAESHFPENSDCTSCHLPKGKAAQVPHIAWTDHRIRKRYDQPDAHFQAWGGTGLVPLLASHADSRDLALAYYDVVAGGNRALFPRALQLAAEAYQQNPADIPVLKALGYLRQSRGDAAAAIELYRQVLKRDPLDPWAANNLAMLVAKTGQVAEAETLWQQTFSRNETTDQIGLNLAIAQCMLGKKTESAETLQRVLHYSPDNKVARQRLSEIRAGTQSCAQRSSP